MPKVVSAYFAVLWPVMIVTFLVSDVLATVTNHEEWTLTHYLAIRVPLSIRIPLLAWLVFHFCFQHIHG